MNRELPTSRQMKTPSKLMRFMWLIAALVLFAATLPIVAAFPTAPISYGYDRHAQSSVAYDRTSLVAFDYDSAPVSLADEMVNRSVGTSDTLAKSVKFLAADSGLIGVTSGESSALARQIYGSEVNGQPAVSSIEAFGSRAGSMFRGRGPLPTSDLDIIITLNESAANPTWITTVNSQLNEIGAMFQEAKGFLVNPIVEILGLPSVKSSLLQTPFIPLKP